MKNVWGYDTGLHNPKSTVHLTNSMDIDLSHSRPGGILAFRYKHGWILINPAIPSRGKMGGGLASKHGHKSGGITPGHFEKSGGVNAHVKFVPHHNSGTSLETHQQISHAKVEKHKAQVSAKQAADATNEAAKLSKMAKFAGTSHAQTVLHKKAEDAHTKAAGLHKKLGNDSIAKHHKWWSAKHHEAVMAADKPKVEEKPKPVAKPIHEYEAAKKYAFKKSDEANNSGKAEDHLAAAKAHEHAGEKAKDVTYATTQAHVTIAETHKKKADEVTKAAAVGEWYDTYKAAALDASKKANEVNTPEAHNFAVQTHKTAGDVAKKAGLSKDAEVHKFAVEVHQAASKKAAEDLAEPKVKESEKPPANMAAALETINDLSPDNLALPNLKSLFEKKYGISYDAAMAKYGDKLKVSKPSLLPPNSTIDADIATIKDFKTKLGLYGGNSSALTSDAMDKLDAMYTAFKDKHGKSFYTATHPLSQPDTPAKPKAKLPTSDKPEDYEVELTGPGMVADGQKVMSILKQIKDAPADQDLHPLDKAYKKAKQDFHEKYGIDFDPSKVGQATPSYYGGTTKLGDSEFFKEAEDAGYHHPDPSEDVTNGWKPPASSVSALKSYTGSGYDSINAQLRKYSPTGGTNDGTIKAMDAAFADAPGLDKDTVTIRRMNTASQFPAYPPPMTVGAEYVDYGYGSTSKSTSGWSGNVVMQVRIPKGTKVIDVNHNNVTSASASEQEVLLPRGAVYKVVNDTMTGGQRNITVEVVATGKTKGE